jgi:hypothetical protein
MRVLRAKVWVVFVSFALIGISAASGWRLLAQAALPFPQQPVQSLKTRPAPPPVTAGDRGVTYHSLESRARRVKTTFADAIAIAERGPDGRLSTRLTDSGGNDVATLRVHRVDAENDSLEFDVPGRLTRYAARRRGLRPTLDWSNQQTYSLWKDRAALDGSALEWQDTYIRPAGSAKRSIDAGALRTDTEWSDGFSATVTRKIGTHVSYATKKPITGVVFISAFKRDGVEVGFSQWWPAEQTFAWSFPGLTEGYVDASRLQASGGWTFAPDMAWMNTQNLAFQEFHTLVNLRGAVGERRPGWLEKIGSFVAPTLSANEPGCDYLHWLDQTIYRPCCDSHDRCYAKPEPACGASSWWMWWSSWQCTQCNIRAVSCFITSSGRQALQRYP